MKKKGKVYAYMDFRDLNVVCPNEFPFPIIDIMISNTYYLERISMDGFSRYHQIKMYPIDEKHAFFQIP